MPAIPREWFDEVGLARSKGMTLLPSPHRSNDAGGQTYGAHPARLAAALRLLNAVCAHGATVADLGCLHGAYTIAFAKAGYRAVGLDARAENIAVCREAAAGTGAQFICDDVRNIENHGPFDAVFCCGLLYHMEQPVRLLRQLAAVTRRLLIVQTHYSVGGGHQNEGCEGQWYIEGDLAHPWSAWGNEQSFWLTRPALFAAIQDAGFGLVAEIHDHLADVNGSAGRLMVAGIKQ
jgi:SAM-dependent methyltransferase